MVRDWRRFHVAVLLVGLACLLSTQPLAAQVQKDVFPPRANLYVYPDKLTDKDKLTDGTVSPIEIKSETTLIWVDLVPDARFAHPTEYILISPEGSRIVKGSWWPVLNGKALFRDGKSYKADFPVSLCEIPMYPAWAGFIPRLERSSHATNVLNVPEP